MAENTVIQIVATTAAVASASIDIPDDGLLLFAHGVIDGAANADAEGYRGELSFGSTASYDINDARQKIGHWQLMIGLLTSGAAPNANSMSYDYGEGIRVFAGERLYLHTANLGTGVFGGLHVLLIFKFKSFTARRR